ncbi:MAG: dipeptidase [Gemmatimonadetes bacterium]|nr:dipeptidase [Gemmatimonadota bacterium]
MSTSRLAGVTALLFILPVAVPAQDLEQRARRIHERVLTIDTHDDIPGNFGTAGMNPCVEQPRQVDVPKMRRGGLDVAFFIVFVGQTPRTPENYERAKDQAMQKFDGIHRVAGQLCPDQIGLAQTADEVERIAATGRLVTVIGIENGYVIGKDLSLLRRYRELGARYMTLAHTAHNDIADTATPSQNGPVSEHDGVSAFGEQVIAEMNRLGIMVDISHISKAAALDALRLTKAPVIASHSSTRAVADHPRNLDDETLLELRRNGGVMQTVAFASYVKVQPAERQAAIQALREEFGITAGRGGGRGALDQLPPDRRAEYDRRIADIERRWPLASVSDFVDHIDHAVRVAGIDHVGISSDFDGGGGVVGWNDASETFNVTLELVRRGYTEEQIAKLWSGNLLRVMRENERIARELSASARAPAP